MLLSPKYHGQAVVALGLSVLLALMLGAWNLYGWLIMWDMFSVYAPWMLWDDLLIIIRGMDCLPAGSFNYLDYHCPPVVNQFNYPMLWIRLFSALGITQEQAPWIAVGMLAVFVSSVFALLRGAPLREGMVVGLAMVSPPVLLVMQRANSDEVIFAMVVFACVLRDRRCGWVASPLLIGCAAFFKLYPGILAGVFFLLARSARERAAWVFTGFAFVLYVFFNMDEFQYISHLTVRGVQSSFGVNVLPELVLEVPPGYQLDEFRGMVQMVLSPLAVGAMWLLAQGYRGYFTQLAQSLRRDRNSAYFYCGAAVFVFMFFAQGNNWNYRMVYLLMCLPQAEAWARSPNATLRGSAYALAVLMLLCLWCAGHWWQVTGAAFTWVMCLWLGALLLRKAQLLSAALLRV